MSFIRNIKEFLIEVSKGILTLILLFIISIILFFIGLPLIALYKIAFKVVFR